jgi:predicted transcriptional regulator
MARSYEEISAELRRDPKHRAAIEREKAAIHGALHLHRLREEAAISQAELAKRLGVSQSRVSAIERAEDLNLSTLQRYVAALGGRLEARAVIGDETIPLTPDDASDREAVPA